MADETVEKPSGNNEMEAAVTLDVSQIEVRLRAKCDRLIQMAHDLVEEQRQAEDDLLIVWGKYRDEADPFAAVANASGWYDYMDALEPITPSPGFITIKLVV